MSESNEARRGARRFLLSACPVSKDKNSRDSQDLDCCNDVSPFLDYFGVLSNLSSQCRD